MLRNLHIGEDYLEVTYKKTFGVFFLLLIYSLCLGFGALFISISFLENSGSKASLFFGVLFVILGLIGLFKSPRAFDDNKFLEFRADKEGIKYNHYIYEVEKIKSLKWAEISKIIISKKLVIHKTFGKTYYSWSNILIYLKHPTHEVNVFITQRKENLTVLNFPRGQEAEILSSMTFIANGNCPISEFKKVVIDYRKSCESYIS